jgi:hypothetical protein
MFGRCLSEIKNSNNAWEFLEIGWRLPDLARTILLTTIFDELRRLDLNASRSWQSLGDESTNGLP